MKATYKNGLAQVPAGKTTQEMVDATNEQLRMKIRQLDRQVEEHEKRIADLKDDKQSLIAIVKAFPTDENGI